MPLATALDLPVFQGPLDLLLTLIERRRLEITEVSLALVADQYLQAVHALPAPDPDLLAEFLVIGTRLLLLKSRALLPRPEEPEQEEPVDDLPARLEEYRRFKEAALALAGRIAGGEQAYLHPPRPEHLDFQPPLAPIEAQALARLWRSIVRRQADAPPAEPVLTPRVQVAERLTYLRDVFRRRPRLRWEEIAGETIDEMIATFLAVLELIRRLELRVHQAHSFGPIQLEALSGPSVGADRLAGSDQAEQLGELPVV